MKTKVIGLLLVLVMLVSMQSALSSDVVFFEPDTLNETNATLNMWYSDDSFRALFTFGLIYDALSSWGNTGDNILAESLTLDTIYISKTDSAIIVYFFGLDECMICRYNQDNGTGAYTIAEFEGASDQSLFIMAHFIGEGEISSYEQVKSELVIDYIDKYLE